MTFEPREIKEILESEFRGFQNLDVLGILTAPTQKITELHTFYYELLKTLYVELPDTIDELSDLPFLDVKVDYGNQFPSGLRSHRLLTLLNQHLGRMEDQYIVSLDDLRRPKKQKTLHLIGSVLNCCLFDKRMRSAKDKDECIERDLEKEKQSLLAVLKELEAQTEQLDIISNNTKNELQAAKTEHAHLHNQNQTFVDREYRDMEASLSALYAVTQSNIEEIDAMEGQLKEEESEIQELNLQLFENPEQVYEEIRELEVEISELELRKQDLSEKEIAKSQKRQTHQNNVINFQLMKEEIDKIIKIESKDREMFAKIETNQKDFNELKLKYEEMKSELRMESEKEELSERQMMIFKTKKDRSDDLKKEELQCLQKEEVELAEEMDKKSEDHKTWQKLQKEWNMLEEKNDKLAGLIGESEHAFFNDSLALTNKAVISLIRVYKEYKTIDRNLEWENTCFFKKENQSLEILEKYLNKAVQGFSERNMDKTRLVAFSDVLGTFRSVNIEINQNSRWAPHKVVDCISSYHALEDNPSKGEFSVLQRELKLFIKEKWSAPYEPFFRVIVPPADEIVVDDQPELIEMRKCLDKRYVELSNVMSISVDAVNTIHEKCHKTKLCSEVSRMYHDAFKAILPKLAGSQDRILKEEAQKEIEMLTRNIYEIKQRKEEEKKQKEEEQRRLKEKEESRLKEEEERRLKEEEESRLKEEEEKRLEEVEEEEKKRIEEEDRLRIAEEVAQRLQEEELRLQMKEAKQREQKGLEERENTKIKQKEKEEKIRESEELAQKNGEQDTLKRKDDVMELSYGFGASKLTLRSPGTTEPISEITQAKSPLFKITTAKLIAPKTPSNLVAAPLKTVAEIYKFRTPTKVRRLTTFNSPGASDWENGTPLSRLSEKQKEILTNYQMNSPINFQRHRNSLILSLFNRDDPLFDDNASGDSSSDDELSFSTPQAPNYPPKASTGTLPRRRSSKGPLEFPKSPYRNSDRLSLMPQKIGHLFISPMDSPTIVKSISPGKRCRTATTPEQTPVKENSLSSESILHPAKKYLFSHEEPLVKSQEEPVEAESPMEVDLPKDDNLQLPKDDEYELSIDEEETELTKNKTITYVEKMGSNNPRSIQPLHVEASSNQDKLSICVEISNPTETCSTRTPLKTSTPAEATTPSNITNPMKLINEAVRLSSSPVVLTSLPSYLTGSSRLETPATHILGIHTQTPTPRLIGMSDSICTPLQTPHQMRFARMNKTYELAKTSLEEGESQSFIDPSLQGDNTTEFEDPQTSPADKRSIINNKTFIKIGIAETSLEEGEIRSFLEPPEEQDNNSVYAEDLAEFKSTTAQKRRMVNNKTFQLAETSLEEGEMRSFLEPPEQHDNNTMDAGDLPELQSMTTHKRCKVNNKIVELAETSLEEELDNVTFLQKRGSWIHHNRKSADSQSERIESKNIERRACESDTQELDQTMHHNRTVYTEVQRLVPLEEKGKKIGKLARKSIVIFEIQPYSAKEEVVAKSQPLPAMSEAMIEAQPSPEMSEAMIQAKLSPEMSEAIIETQHSSEMSEVVIKAQHSPEMSEAMIEVQHSPEMSEAMIEAQPSPEMSKARIEAQHSPEISEARIEAQPSPEMSNARIEAQPSPEMREAMIEAQHEQTNDEPVTCIQKMCSKKLLQPAYVKSSSPDKISPITVEPDIQEEEVEAHVNCDELEENIEPMVESVPEMAQGSLEKFEEQAAEKSGDREYVCSDYGSDDSDENYVSVHTTASHAMETSEFGSDAGVTTVGEAPIKISVSNFKTPKGNQADDSFGIDDEVKVPKYLYKFKMNPDNQGWMNLISEGSRQGRIVQLSYMPLIVTSKEKNPDHGS